MHAMKCYRCGKSSTALCTDCGRPVCGKCLHPGMRYCRSCHGLSSQPVKKKKKKPFIPKDREQRDKSFWEGRLEEVSKMRGRVSSGDSRTLAANLQTEINLARRMIETYENKERLAEGNRPEAWTLATVLRNPALTEEGKLDGEIERGRTVCPVCGHDAATTCPECGWVDRKSIELEYITG